MEGRSSQSKWGESDVHFLQLVLHASEMASSATAGTGHPGRRLHEARQQELDAMPQKMSRLTPTPGRTPRRLLVE